MFFENDGLEGLDWGRVVDEAVVTWVRGNVMVNFICQSGWVTVLRYEVKLYSGCFCKIILDEWELDCEKSWVLKNWCFWTVVLEKTVVLKRLFRVPWTARRSNQSILKEITLEYSLEGLMLKLKLPYIGHLMQRFDSLEKTLILGKFKVGGEGDNRGWDGWKASPTQRTFESE